MNEMFQPVRTRRAFEAVCDQVRAQLMSGVLRPGDRLPGEVELAERFRIGRSAVREALRSLEVSGLVEARKGVNGGFYIQNGSTGGLAQTVQDMVSLSQTSLESVTEARIELTGVAIRLACARATEEEFDAIQRDIDHHTELFRIGQGSRNRRSVTEFYRLIAQATHNAMIVMMLDALSEVYRSLLARLDPAPNKDIMVVRQRVLDLMRKRDAPAATQAMAAYLREVSDYLVRGSANAPNAGEPSPKR
jgi:GntR family transcriptional regulator, transcriptional repressor for pyruvate dehydrogenase complex